MRKRRDQKRNIKVQICPRCRSCRVKRVGALDGDMTGAMGILSPKFQCQECNWIGTLVIKEIIELQKKDVENKTEKV